MSCATAIIPAFNEQALVGETVRAALGCEDVTEAIVVDDGSSDRTASLAADAGARVLSLEWQWGKGHAMSAGLQECNTPVVVFLDADLGACASEATQLLRPVIDGDADVAIAAIPLPGGAVGRGWVTGLSRWAGLRWGGLCLGNPLSGQRAMKTETARALLPFGAGFAVETRMNISMGRLPLSVMEVPTTMTHRRSGRDLPGMLHRGRQLLAVAGESARWLAVAPLPEKRRTSSEGTD